MTVCCRRTIQATVNFHYHNWGPVSPFIWLDNGKKPEWRWVLFCPELNFLNFVRSEHSLKNARRSRCPRRINIRKMLTANRKLSDRGLTLLFMFQPDPPLSWWLGHFKITLPAVPTPLQLFSQNKYLEYTKTDKQFPQNFDSVSHI